MATRGNVQREYIIQGVVVDRVSQRGVRGVRVDTWDKDTKYHDLLGQAVTDDDGAFTVAFDSVYFGDYAPDVAPDVFFRIYRDDVEVMTTFDKPMKNMQRGTTRVRLEIDVPEFQPVGRDLVTTQQAWKAVDWWQASDFRGVYRQTRDKTSTVGKLFGTLTSDAIKNFDFTPVVPKGTQERDVVNQDQDTARRALAAQQIEVSEVKSVNSLAGRAQLKSIAEYPIQLQSGDRVTLYEQDGTVKYYTRDPAPATVADEATITRIDGDVQAIKARVQSVDDLRVEVANVKAANDDVVARTAQDTEATRSQADELAQVKQELEVVRQASATKDVQIQKLQSDLTTVSKAQDDLAGRVSLDRIQALEVAVQRVARASGTAIDLPVFTGSQVLVNTPAIVTRAVAKSATKSATTSATKSATTSAVTKSATMKSAPKTAATKTAATTKASTTKAAATKRAPARKSTAKSATKKKRAKE